MVEDGSIWPGDDQRRSAGHLAYVSLYLGFTLSAFPHLAMPPWCAHPVFADWCVRSAHFTPVVAFFAFVAAFLVSVPAVPTAFFVSVPAVLAVFLVVWTTALPASFVV